VHEQTCPIDATLPFFCRAFASNASLRQKIEHIAEAPNMPERKTQAARTALHSCALWSAGKLEAARLVWIRHFVQHDVLPTVAPGQQVDCWTSHTTFWSELFWLDRTLVNYSLSRTYTCTNVECPHNAAQRTHDAIAETPIVDVRPRLRGGPPLPFVAKLMTKAIQNEHDNKLRTQPCATAWPAFFKLDNLPLPNNEPPAQLCAGNATVINTVTALPEMFVVDLLNVYDAAREHQWNLSSLPRELEIDHQGIHATFDLIGLVNHSGIHYSTYSLFGTVWFYEDAMQTLRTCIKEFHYSHRFRPIQVVYLKKQ